MTIYVFVRIWFIINIPFCTQQTALWTAELWDWLIRLFFALAVVPCIASAYKVMGLLSLRLLQVELRILPHASHLSVWKGWRWPEKPGQQLTPQILGDCNISIKKLCIGSFFWFQRNNKQMQITIYILGSLSIAYLLPDEGLEDKAPSLVFGTSVVFPLGGVSLPFSKTVTTDDRLNKFWRPFNKHHAPTMWKFWRYCNSNILCNVFHLFKILKIVIRSYTTLY